eukprot:evm.model.scf_2912EXC.2 EVM.evm.TU.scf_2912EXC.2   scf_2912EXC:5509-6318(+)
MRWAVAAQTTAGRAATFSIVRLQRRGLPRGHARVNRDQAEISGSPAAEDAQERPSRLQALYDVGRRTFGRRDGTPPSREEVLAVLGALKEVPIEELGLVEPPARRTKWGGLAQSITYLPVKEVEMLHVGVFCMPANTVIPLHDHPGMTVLSRVVYGRVRVTSYDWVEGAGWGSGGAAKRVGVVEAAGPAGTSELLPTYANVHSLEALTPSAILDVLAPPYAPWQGRDCTYFRAVPRPDGGQNDVLLEPIMAPAHLRIQRGEYRGVVVHN